METLRPSARSLPCGATAAPVRVSLGQPASIEQPYIAIRDRASRAVVTIVDVLSPINKVSTTTTGAVSSARAEFLQKRRSTMASSTHWLEIDLLRAGERPPEVRSAKPGPYYAVRTWVGATDLEVWPIGLRDPLPAIGVPLPSPRQEVALDLQEALDLVFHRYRYAALLDYRRPPLLPAFALDDALWLAGRVERGQSAHAGNGIGDGPPDQ